MSLGTINKLLYLCFDKHSRPNVEIKGREFTKRLLIDFLELKPEAIED